MIILIITITIIKVIITAVLAVIVLVIDGKYEDGDNNQIKISICKNSFLAY